jgi:O-antigen/teichoic acid export membrane protein
MVSSATGAFLGFIFWIIVARFYSAEEVGLASAAIAAAGMLASISYLGLGTGLIRFLPQSGSNRSAMVNTVFTIGALGAIIITLIFVAGLGFWSPALLFIRESPVYLLAFIVCVAAMNLYQLLAETFVAERRASFVLSGGLISGSLKLAFLVLLASFLHSSGFGIFSSWSIATTTAFLTSLLIFLPRVQPGYKPIPTINTKLLKDMWRYSFVNFLSILLLYFLRGKMNMTLLKNTF